jgi:hypothetical protein
VRMLPSFRASVLKFLLILCSTISTISAITADDRQIKVTISNDSSVPVQIYWQIGEDFQATPKNFRSYQGLAPGEAVTFPSNPGQTWLVFEPRSRRAVGMLKASFRQRQLVLADRDIRMVQGRASNARFHNRTDRTVAFSASASCLIQPSRPAGSRCRESGPTRRGNSATSKPAGNCVPSCLARPTLKSSSSPLVAGDIAHLATMRMPALRSLSTIVHCVRFCSGSRGNATRTGSKATTSRHCRSKRTARGS